MIANVKIVAVIWGGFVNKTTVGRVGGFLSALVNSTFVDQLSIYDTTLKAVNGQAGTNQSIHRGTYVGQFKITPFNASPGLTDANIEAELARQIAAGKLPKADLNTLYMIYFPFNISITAGKDKSCVNFGAYHSATSASVTAANVFYGVMPDCGGGFGDITVASSHEFAEAVTDSIPTAGSHPAYPQAWNTSDGNEIADLCESTSARLRAGTKTYLVQEVYLNTTAACGKGNFTSP